MRLISVFLLVLFFTSNTSAQSSSKWVMGYLTTYQQNPDGTAPFLTSSEMSKLTHLMSFGPEAKSDGSISMVSNSASNIKLGGAVTLAHANNIPAILSISAWYTEYLPAIQNTTTRNALVTNIMALFDSQAFDGIDIDLEPVMSAYVAGMQTDNPDYVTFVNLIYDELQTRNSTLLNRKPLLTVAANGYAAPVLKQLEAKFDMINIMTYDLAGVYPGWVPWHDSALFDGGNNMPSTGQPMPSVNSEIQICLAEGIAPGKLGIGISMDAFRWKGGTGTSTGGVTAPMQQYSTDPTWKRISFSDFYQNYYNSDYYHYDNVAKMSYLGKNNVGSANDEFWSYNDEQSIKDKISYVWNQSLGGTIIWELKSGYVPTAAAGSKIPQLNYIHNQNSSLFSAQNMQCGTATAVKN